MTDDRSHVHRALQIDSDIWESTSWSSIEYGGRWKPLHYLSQRSMDRVAAQALYHPDNSTLELHVLSDLWQGVSGKATWSWYTYAGERVGRHTCEFSVNGINATLLHQASGMNNILPEGAKAENVYLHLEVSGRAYDGQMYSNEQFWTPAPLRDAPLADPGIVLKRVKGHPCTFEITATKAVAPWTWLEHPEGVIGHFVSDRTGKPSNAFFLRKGETRKLRFVPRFDRTDGRWKEGVVVRSVWDNTH